MVVDKIYNLVVVKFNFEQMAAFQLINFVGRCCVGDVVGAGCLTRNLYDVLRWFGIRTDHQSVVERRHIVNALFLVVKLHFQAILCGWMHLHSQLFFAICIDFVVPRLTFVDVTCLCLHFS